MEWNDKTRTVTINGNIQLVIGFKNASIYGELAVLDAPAEITVERTFVPTRFVSEALGG